MIWEPFVLALVLGLIVSAGLYFAYLWPSVEPLDEEHEDEPRITTATTAAAPPAPARAAEPEAADDTDGDEDTPLPPPAVPFDDEQSVVP